MDAGIDPVHAAGTRATRAQADAICLQEYNCDVDERVDALDQRTRFRCLRPGCGARLQRMRDCKAHHERHVATDESEVVGRGGVRVVMHPPADGVHAGSGVSPPSSGLQLHAPAAIPLPPLRTGRPGEDDAGPAPPSPLVSFRSGMQHTPPPDSPASSRGFGAVGTSPLAGDAAPGGEFDPDGASSADSASIAVDSDLSDSDDEYVDGPRESQCCDGGCWGRTKPLPGAPVAGTGAWYHYHRQCTILPDHNTTVMGAAFSVAMLKDEHRVPDVVIDKLCKYICASTFTMSSCLKGICSRGRSIC